MKKISIPIVILSFVALLLVAYNRIFPVFVLLNLLVLIAFIYLDIYIHEFGHVIAARLAGIGVNRVIIGNGKELLRKSIFGISVVITNNIGGALTLMGSIDRNLLKMRFAFFVAGGVLFQSLLTVASYVLFGTKDWTLLFTSEIGISNMFVFSNILLIVTNLIPRHFNMYGLSIPNDGLRILTAPFLKEKDINGLLFADRIFKAHENFEKKEYLAAAAAYEKCIVECPDLLISRLNLSVVLLKLLNFDKAENVLMQLLHEDGIDKYSCLIYNNLAWVNLLYYTDESLRKAADFSKIAFDLNSSSNSIIGTRGSVLIALGSINEGIELLSQITKFKKEIDPKTNNATDFLFLAYGYLTANKGDEGNKYLNRAESYYTQMEPDEKYLFEFIKNRIITMKLTEQGKAEGRPLEVES
jgi:hypothetical protein